MLENAFVRLVGTDPLWQALVGGLVIAGFNAVGALSVLVWRNPSDRALDGALGFAGGVMLAASFTSLIIPGIEEYAGGSLFPVVAGILLGAVVLDRGEKWVPYVQRLVTGRRSEEFSTDGGAEAEAAAASRAAASDRVAPVIVFIVAITLHNMPEALAVGVGFGSDNLGNAIALMLAIGIQNIPEGLAVAVAARNAGLGSLFYAGVTGIRSGLVEVPLAVFGAVAVSVAAPLLPYAMGFAAGGMLYVIVDEIIPQTHARGHERVATLGTIVGLVVMLSLDVALG
ncbi:MULTISPECIES: ZIP family metal transporter [Halococcus]|uniref:Zinc/iron permease n=1 Tax=Halococcus salifodinae DSM 8989 TaxID=1227456 RepID=M0MVN7_9EURY|nr:MULTISPECIES: ZIP family metal transporter [Halococcus]EMA49812.1 zinc/iron permease [Halococcus salifodinae DSM 8989]